MMKKVFLSLCICILLSGFLNLENSTAGSLFEITDCAITGDHVVSSLNGSTRNWAYKHASFLPNDVATVQVVKSDLMALGLAGNVNISMSMWVKPDDGQPAASNILGGQWTAADGSRKIRIELPGTGIIRVNLSSLGTAIDELEETDAAVFPNGACSSTNVAYVYNGTTVVIYINGAAVASTTGGGGIPPALHPSPALFALGALITPASYFAGKMDGIRVYNRALSAKEIMRIYQSQRGWYN